MLGFPHPSCPACRGSGEIETWTRHGDLVVAIDFSPCPCTLRPLIEPEEDWTNDRHPTTC